MDYLALCKRTWDACGLSGGGPVDVKKATSMHKRVVDWVDDASIHIQQLHYNWSFLWNAATGTLLAGQPSYSSADLGIADFGWLISIRLLDGITPLPLSYRRNFDPFKFGSKSGQPAEFTIRPDMKWAFDPRPSKNYSLELEYFRAPQHLVENTDVPLIPDEFQHLIVHKAKMLYALYDESASDLQDAAEEYKATLVRAEAKFLPSIDFPRSPF